MWVKWNCRVITLGSFCFRKSQYKKTSRRFLTPWSWNPWRRACTTLWVRVSCRAGDSWSSHGSSTCLSCRFAFFNLGYNFILTCQSPSLACEPLWEDRDAVLLMPGMQLGLRKYQLNERHTPKLIFFLNSPWVLSDRFSTSLHRPKMVPFFSLTLKTSW